MSSSAPLNPPGRRKIVLQWSMSSASGWGVYALNLGLNWAADPRLLPVFCGPLHEDHIFLDPLRSRVLAPVVAASRAFVAMLEPHAGKQVKTAGIAMHALGDGLYYGPAAHGTAVDGDATLGAVFFENTHIDAAAHERARRYELIVAGSTWNREVLERNRIGPVVTVLQGVDPTLFHPAGRSGLYADRFLIFSGGKLEHRKGQDLVLLAFKAFAARHAEALLVTAWHSPWPDVARGFDSANSRAGAVPFTAGGTPDVIAWAAANGVAAGQIVDLGQLPNMLMAPILREMDAAVFPNRCEGGTNLVAMECMACGIPTILSANTGHLDLARGEHCMALNRQRAIPSAHPAFGTDDWGESDVDEIVEALERVWQDRAAAAAIGAAGARFMAQMTWARQTQRLKEAILPYLP